MWSAETPEADGHLHQGDLLLDVPIPSLNKRPEQDKGGQWVMKCQRVPCLVVSQCCTIEQRGVVQVAKVLKTMQMDATHPTYQALRSDWPAAPGALMYDAMRIDPIADVLPDPGEGRLWTVDFRAGVTFQKDATWLREHVRARMTPVSRRNLRLRLAGFYSRATAEDRGALEAAGEWTDMGDAPAWVTR